MRTEDELPKPKFDYGLFRNLYSCKILLRIEILVKFNFTLKPWLGLIYYYHKNEKGKKERLEKKVVRFLL